MGRIEAAFERLRREGKSAFMPFVTACDPTPGESVQVVLALAQAGADIVELGFAYSDPLADGPVIQDSYARVLGGGHTVDDALSVVREIRKRSQIPIAAMVSYSIIWRRGGAAFVREVRHAGADAIIVPDIPPEEAGELCAAGRASSTGIVFLVTPTTGPARARRIVDASQPFVYYVSVVGITGARKTLPPELSAGVRSIKAMTGKPVAVGFGVSTPAQAGEVAKAADGVIVGSAIVKVVSDSLAAGAPDIAGAVRSFAAPIAKAVNRSR